VRISETPRASFVLIISATFRFYCVLLCIIIVVGSSSGIVISSSFSWVLICTSMRL